LARDEPHYCDRLAYERKLERRTPVFIYQMGKVASSTLFRSLAMQYPGVVLRSHKFAADYGHWKVRRFYRWVLAEARRLNVISLVREPVSRNVSAFFQNFERDAGQPYQEGAFSTDELKALFLERFNHGEPLDWFENHISRHFGIDVYTTPFPGGASATYVQANIRLLIVRVEAEDDAKIRAVKEFLGMPEFHLLPANISATKAYAEGYRAFRKGVKLPAEYVAWMCDSRYCRHFYSEEEIEAIRGRWSAA
jgi:hypothetical protein